MDKKQTAKDGTLPSQFILQLDKCKKVKDIKITNRDTKNGVSAIGGTFKLYDAKAHFFYSESVSFLGINVRSIYQLENTKKSSEPTLLQAVNKYNEVSFGTKICLLSCSDESFNIELNVESILNPSSTKSLPIEPMIMILARSINEIDTSIESLLINSQEG
ncbi:hypothetical protein JAF86_004399 [Citrobacter braakii]|nr:hypothetical protein [Citrobacter braakii]